jgi:O-acetyl-ADP-ribose deacetylase (regulator of RNase III)
VLKRGDLTLETTDAIVNAANSSLMGGGGVDGAIHKRGGPEILEACRAIRTEQGPLPKGKAVITTGGNLEAKFVIHTVGPIWSGGNEGEEEKLKDCYRNSLGLALEKGLRTVAFPSISTGAYGYPIDEASSVALAAVINFLEEKNAASSEPCLDAVLFCLFSDSDLDTYCRALETLLP